MDMAANHAWIMNQTAQGIVQNQWDEHSVYSPLCGPMISIYAGSERVLFMVHLGVVCSQSLYFRRQFNTTFPPPGGSLVIHLPNIDAKDMAMFMNCVYRLYWKDYDLKITTEPNHEITEHVRLYVISLVFSANILRKKVFSAIESLLHEESPEWIRSLSSEEFKVYFKCRLELIGLVYGATEDCNDPLRLAFAKSIAIHSDEYYECGHKYGICIDDELSGLFASAPGFAKDLEKSLFGDKGGSKRRRSVTILDPLIEEDEDSDDQDDGECEKAEEPEINFVVGMIMGVI